MRKILILAGILASLGVPWASATVEVRIINVGVADTGWITCATATCSFVGALGNYSITSDITVQNTTSNPLLDMSYSASSLTNSNPGTIVIEAMASGYNVNTPELQLIDNGNSHYNPGTFSDAAYGGNNNNICPAGVNACWNNNAPSGTSSQTIATGGPFPATGAVTTWAVNKIGPGSTTTPYSLGLVVTLANPSGLSTFSGDAAIDAVPEPASVVLLGGVMLLTMGALRRKLRHNA